MRRFLPRLVISTSATDPRRGAIRTPAGFIPCALGRSSIHRFKREGDGATPLGRWRAVAVFWRPDRLRRPAALLPGRALRAADGWCDDPADRHYNRPVRLPFAASHERLWREDHLYDVVVVLDYNLARPRPGAGSAIFLHIAKPEFAPTEGCIAVTPAAMRRLLATIGPGTVFDVR